ncbi:MAG: RNA 2'-phosphotransferase [Verrucomicrobiota bacterium]
MSDPKKSAWDGYQRWKVITLFTLPLWVFPFYMQGWPIKWARDLFVFWIPFFILHNLAFAFITYFRCPSCRQYFFYDFPFPMPFARKCVHCGLPKWDEPPTKPAKVGLYPIPSGDNLRPDPVTAERLRLANFLTLVLRDDPGAIGLRLDLQGWADADHLVERANRYGLKFTRENVAEILTIPGDHRFEWDQLGGRIRWVKS